MHTLVSQKNGAFCGLECFKIRACVSVCANVHFFFFFNLLSFLFSFVGWPVLVLVLLILFTAAGVGVDVFSRCCNIKHFNSEVCFSSINSNCCSVNIFEPIQYTRLNINTQTHKLIYDSAAAAVVVFSFSSSEKILLVQFERKQINKILGHLIIESERKSLDFVFVLFRFQKKICRWSAWFSFWIKSISSHYHIVLETTCVSLCASAFFPSSTHLWRKISFASSVSYKSKFRFNVGFVCVCEAHSRM